MTPLKSPMSCASSVLPVRQPFVEARLQGGQWYRALIDTGSPYTLIARALLEDAGWRSDQVESGEPEELGGAFEGGASSRSWVQVLDLEVRSLASVRARLLRFERSVCRVVDGRLADGDIILGQRDFLERVAFAQRNQPPRDALEVWQLR